MKGVKVFSLALSVLLLTSTSSAYPSLKEKENNTEVHVIRTSMEEEHVRHVLQAVLKYLEVHSPSFEELLLMTLCVESNMGTYLKCTSGTGTVGAFQITRHTEDWILLKWIRHPSREDIKKKLLNLRSPVSVKGAPQLMTDLTYQTALAACIYMSRTDIKKLPKATDSRGLAEIYKKCFNTSAGSASVEGTQRRYLRIVKGK